jgi:hypothetical protein
MKNITFWVVVAIAVVATLVLYRLAQPQCEPCMEGQDCSPCISNWQIAIVIGGVAVVAAAFLLKKFRPTTTNK